MGPGVVCLRVTPSVLAVCPVVDAVLRGPAYDKH